MVSALDSGVIGRVSSVVFLGKTFYPCGASLHPDVQMGTGEFNAEGNPEMGQRPIQEGVEIHLAASCL